MHLKGAIPPSQFDAPGTVANQLDFVVPCVLDVDFNQEILVVAWAGCLGFQEHFHHCIRCFFRLAYYTLTFASPSADMFQTDSPPREVMP